MSRMRKKIQSIRMITAVFTFFVVMTGTILPVYAESADNSLASRSLSEGTLSPAFQGSHLNYTATVSADTTAVEVKAKPVNAAAQVTSITGNTSLSEGKNKIQVVVQAENGNLATYTIVVTRPAASDAQPQEAAGGEASDAQETPEEPDESTPDEGGSDETIGAMVSEGAYEISDSFSEDQIPEDFTPATVTYQGEEHNGLVSMFADVTLIYMQNENGDGAFFVYDPATLETYPFIRLACDSGSIILLAHEAPAENYTPAELYFDPFSFQSAYQKEAGDFYQVYAVNGSGIAGWYQYDAAEGTYQRYTVEVASVAEEPEDDGYLQQALGDLNDKFQARKARDMKIIAALIVVCVLLLFVIINLLLRGRRGKADEDETLEADEVWKSYEKELSESESVFSKSKKTENDSAGWEDEEDFYGFDEEPELLAKKKGRAKKDKREKVRDIFDDDDRQSGIFEKENLYAVRDSEEEDLQIMDLNDL
ncbi:MAG: cadherin-like beta sandwich domain-containing protein [Lachnospiraceae bacterium]|nr:cadherin-like beta sandwich domain-containing protein [Lachnospiraceae bacterium]